MKRLPNNRRRAGFTFVDFMIVLCTVVIFFALVIPFLSRPRVRSSRINCVSNLKQVGVAFELFANDNENHFPMSLSTNKGGTKEFISTGETYHHFLSVGTELSAPRTLVCPEDKDRISVPAFTTNFAQFNNSNISYFIGLDADKAESNMLLSGDRNITNSTAPRGPILTLSAQGNPGWTKGLHSAKAKEPGGNIGLADGSAQQVNNLRLRQVLASATNAVQRIMLP